MARRLETDANHHYLTIEAIKTGAIAPGTSPSARPSNRGTVT
jgi:hypothetical protein